MNRFLTLVKMNIKLLLRNKAFIFFLCFTPILSVLILNLKTESTIYSDKELNYITELESISDKAIYVGDTSSFIVKVYDAEGGELSEYVLEKLAKSGMFSVCRADASKQTEDEILNQAKKDAYNDRAGTFLYIKEGFDENVLKGDYENAIQIYAVSDDERWELFESELTDTLTTLHQLAQKTGSDSQAVLKLLESVEEKMPQKEIVNLSGKEDIALTDEDSDHRVHIGYAFAIITLGFLFCGVCVAHTVIEEQQNKVYTRIMLSKVGRWEYLCSKLVMVIVISVMQTFLLGVCMFAVKDIDFGINKFSFLLIIFFLGLIFSVLSLCIGILLGDAMSANYAVFSVWSISALLAGLYFPVDNSSKAIKALSTLMPQRWFLRATEMLFVGDKGAYSMVIYITIAYLVVIMSVGAVGLKIKRAE